jgi:hypothetical protein
MDFVSTTGSVALYALTGFAVFLWAHLIDMHTEFYSRIFRKEKAFYTYLNSKGFTRVDYHTYARGEETVIVLKFLGFMRYTPHKRTIEALQMFHREIKTTTMLEIMLREGQKCLSR